MSAQPMSATRPDLSIEEIGTLYVSHRDRFVVSLVVGYAPEDSSDTACPDDPDGLHYIGCGCDDVEYPPLSDPRAAAYWAYQLTQDAGAGDTVWHVYDRATKTMHTFEERQFIDAGDSYPERDPYAHPEGRQ